MFTRMPFPAARVRTFLSVKEILMSRPSFIGLGILLVLTSCGGGDSGNGSGNGSSNGGGDALAVSIESNDQMQFNNKTFTVKSGQTVKLTLKNVGKMPKAAMGHNLVILKAGVKAMEFGTQAMAGGSLENNYLPDSIKDKALWSIKILGPGESETLEFTAPAAGKYEYVCTFPGHFASMRGIMVVE